LLIGRGRGSIASFTTSDLFKGDGTRNASWKGRDGTILVGRGRGSLTS